MSNQKYVILDNITHEFLGQFQGNYWVWLSDDSTLELSDFNTNAVFSTLVEAQEAAKVVSAKFAETCKTSELDFRIVEVTQIIKTTTNFRVLERAST